jgi:hypothetical protein
MRGTLTVYLGDLAESLLELRRRFRRAARLEVARAVGETLQELALTAIGGYGRSASPRAQSTSNWGDPWQDDLAESAWESNAAFSKSFEDEAPARDIKAPPLRAALVLGLGAARWGYCRTRQPVVAIFVGAVVVLVVLVGGPAVEAFADAWATATDLVGFPTYRLA